MQITFVSNYINHHQIPVSDKLYELTNGSYTFIQVEPMEEERIKLGWDLTASNKPYVKLYYEDKDECDRLIAESDCVIFGGTENEELIIPRIENHKFTVRYSERLYKEGRWKFISPRGLIKKYHDHIRFKNYPVYMLCSGAFVKGDFRIIGAYKNKLLKYGYFPKTEHYDDVDKYRHNNEKTKILWAARFIDWKHPEMMIELAKNLLKNNKNFHITMVGNGNLEDKVKEEASKNDLDEYISFAGNKTPDEVRSLMLESDIFVSTSDHKEGWGAVVNEAMNSGCITIAAKSIGAAPYLINHGKNGFVYSEKSSKELLNCVLKAIKDKESGNNIGLNAYNSIVNLWNAETAAERLYAFILNENRNIDMYKEGPLSRA